MCSREKKRKNKGDVISKRQQFKRKNTVKNSRWALSEVQRSKSGGVCYCNVSNFTQNPPTKSHKQTGWDCQLWLSGVWVILDQWITWPRLKRPFLERSWPMCACVWNRCIKDNNIQYTNPVWDTECWRRALELVRGKKLCVWYLIKHVKPTAFHLTDKLHFIKALIL